MKLKFNACPKCSGDLEFRRDIYGMFVSCLQCGLQRDLDAPTPVVDLVKPNAAKSAVATAKSRIPTPDQELLKAA